MEGGREGAIGRSQFSPTDCLAQRFHKSPHLPTLVALVSPGPHITPNTPVSQAQCHSRGYLGLPDFRYLVQVPRGLPNAQSSVHSSFFCFFF